MLSQPAAGPRALGPVEFVEEFATSKPHCAALQRLFAYRKRLLDAEPLWFTQLVWGALLEPATAPEHPTAHTLFVAARNDSDDWRRRFPELFVEASVRGRFTIEGRAVVVTTPAELFRNARALAVEVLDAVEVPFVTLKEEGAARAILETRRQDIRKGRGLQARAVKPSKPEAKSSLLETGVGTVCAPPLPSDAKLEPLVPRPFIAYDLGLDLPLRLEPAAPDREWIDATPQRYAARCLPLLIANQSGWEVVLDEELVATWNGQAGIGSVAIAGTPLLRRCASSHFGSGILTFHLPYLFRTPPGYNLLVRGPCNRPKAGASPLEGVVETDWTAASFTMNWRLTDIDRPVRFAAGDVIAMLVPQRRGELEHFDPRLVPVLDNPDIASRHEIFCQSRTGFLDKIGKVASTEQQEGWQRYYFQGRDPDGTVAPEHQTKLKLKPFGPSR